jgi:serine/threonine-protein kinase
MGTVYRAQHPSRPDPVALKILDKMDTSNSMKRGAGVELVEFAATLNHPRIHPIFQVLESSTIGIVMPLAAKRSLGDFFSTGRQIPTKHALNLVAQIATGLDFLHSQEVAHGSLKPTNVLLDAEGNVTLTDVSMAHLRELGLVPPKPTDQQLYYMPPEREYHSTPEIAGDVFSLAVLTYRILSNEMPFSDPEPEARLDVIAGRGLPAYVAAVLRRAMNPHLRLRYKTINEFMGALQGALRGEIDRDTQKVFGITQTMTPPPDLSDESKP